MAVEEGKSIRLENVLSLRKKMAQTEINTEMMKIGRFLNDNGLRKSGPIITATFAVDTADGQPLVDMEILVPIDRAIEPFGGYGFKKVFHLVNAVYAKHMGNPALLQKTYNEILEHIRDNNLQQITAGYNVNVKDPQPGQSLDEMVVDVYIGVNPNIL